MRISFLALWLVLSPAFALAWDNHDEVTHFALQAYESWETASFESIDEVLPVLSVSGQKAPATRDEFIKQLVIQGDKVQWDWKPSDPKATLIDVVKYGSVEPDFGMDQNLNLSPDQKYMGGFTGPTSQAIRHMYYRAFSPLNLLATFHFPLHEMGMAPDRADLFLELAKQAKAKGHAFWAHRFLGWGLHYVQDLGQPYHANQFANFDLLPIRILVSKGWDAFVEESTRIVSNFHLSFEEYVNQLIEPTSDTGLVLAFKVPRANESLKYALEQNPEMPAKKGIMHLVVASSELAPKLADREDDMMGTVLRDSKMDIRPGFKDESGRPKINFAEVENKPGLKEAVKELHDAAFEALSNTGVATRWYVDRFRAAP